jgi:hypothetical protein
MPSMSRRNLVGLFTAGATVAAAGLPAMPAVAQTPPDVSPRAIRDYTTALILDSAGQTIKLRF